MELGRIGVWRSKRHGTSGLDEIEALGYGAFWLGGSPSIDETRPYLDATTTLPVLTGILRASYDEQELAKLSEVADDNILPLWQIGRAHV